MRENRKIQGEIQNVMANLQALKEMDPSLFHLVPSLPYTKEEPFDTLGMHVYKISLKSKKPLPPVVDQSIYRVHLTPKQVSQAARDWLEAVRAENTQDFYNRAVHYCNPFTEQAELGVFDHLEALVKRLPKKP